jgi:hypothetical protein
MKSVFVQQSHILSIDGSQSRRRGYLRGCKAILIEMEWGLGEHVRDSRSDLLILELLAWAIKAKVCLFGKLCFDDD